MNIITLSGISLYYEAHQKGSHVIMRRKDKGCIIPRHKQLAVGTLRSDIQQAGIRVEELVEVCK